MTKAVLTTKIDPTYDDLPEQRYHFPRTYLRQVEAALSDWIVYYEPRRPSGDLMRTGGKQAYFATARIASIISDPSKPDHFYALIEDFLPFDHDVPFKDGSHYYESGLQKADGSTNKGAFGRAVRTMPETEYDLILAAGFAHVLGVKDRTRPVPDPAEQANDGFREQNQVAYEPEFVERRLISQVVQRPFRDRAFSAAIKTAYRDTCAVTGLKLINGGGRSEVEAAHIRPVADNGPDSVRNGIALSGTVHWMFDRGLISVDDDYSILIAEGSVPDTARRLINSDLRLILPDRFEDRPHSQFLRHHRNTVFKG
ncbi:MULTISPECIES: HNH endonuclease [Rhizobiaceae]|uniref:Restriction endonuclease n=1 Tax=Ferranicluibacter rubi TaxID=2715133 RepID=A0AA44C8V9_9HYPH|nr:MULTISPECIES: HNH endonuclease [Rhizobiaceae]NHT74209.1 restriction endonuclease [Ferranicluibacter rubi]TCQ12060.1 putative restriction endonuclease [Rhizobium sp. PP-F2F-G36]SER95821.1 putative restriction endonuclease [Rhizobium sp. NFR03]